MRRVGFWCLLRLLLPHSRVRRASHSHGWLQGAVEDADEAGGLLVPIQALPY